MYAGGTHVVGHIGGKTANRSWRPSTLPDRSKEVSSRLNVGAPSKPSSVTGIHVHGNVLKVEILQGVSNSSLVRRGGVRAFLHAEVGDQVGKTVRLDDEDDVDIRVSLDLSGDGINVGLVVRQAIVGDAVFSVGSQSSAVAIRKVVDDKLAHVWWVRTGLVQSLNVGEVFAHNWDLVRGVHPEEGADVVGNLAGGSLEATSQAWDCIRVDLTGVLRDRVELVSCEWVAACTARRASGGSRGSLGGSRRDCRVGLGSGSSLLTRWPSCWCSCRGGLGGGRPGCGGTARAWNALRVVRVLGNACVARNASLTAGESLTSIYCSYQ